MSVSDDLMSEYNTNNRKNVVLRFPIPFVCATILANKQGDL